MKYFIIVFLTTLFVIGFVWQNVEVVKIKLEYQKLNKMADDIYREKDILVYKIEKYRNIEVVKNKAQLAGYKELSPKNIVVVSVDDEKR